MNNPFEIIDTRLSTIENLLTELTQSGTPGSNYLPANKPSTQQEITAFLGVTEATIIRWRKKGKIPFMQIGSRVLYDKNKVVEALEKKK
jgi:excisionase family DNA binding protein